MINKNWRYTRQIAIKIITHFKNEQQFERENLIKWHLIVLVYIINIFASAYKLPCTRKNVCYLKIYDCTWLVNACVTKMCINIILRHRTLLVLWLLKEIELKGEEEKKNKNEATRNGRKRKEDTISFVMHTLTTNTWVEKKRVEWKSGIQSEGEPTHNGETKDDKQKKNNKKHMW